MPRNTRRLHSLKKRIVFVDNDSDNWKSDMDRFSKSIDFIFVKSDMDNVKSPQESNYTKNLAYQGNRYAAAIIAATGSNRLSYPPNNGIDDKVEKKLRSWARKVRGTKYALLDWDRTISCVEGIVPSAIPSRNKEFLDDVFEYLMREDRIPMLKSLFRELKDNGVHIHILTNNPAASVDSPYRAIFIEMLSRLFNDDNEKTEEREYVENGVYVRVFSSSSSKLSLISREELDAMLHSTVDYTLPGKPLQKSNMVCSVVPGIRHCPRMTRRRRVVPLGIMIM